MSWGPQKTFESWFKRSQYPHLLSFGLHISGLQNKSTPTFEFHSNYEVYWQHNFLWAGLLWWKYRYGSIIRKPDVLIKGECHGELKDVLTTISNYKEEHVTYQNSNAFYNKKQGQLTIKQATALLTGRWHRTGLRKCRKVLLDEESWDVPLNWKVRSPKAYDFVVIRPGRASGSTGIAKLGSELLKPSSIYLQNAGEPTYSYKFSEILI